MSPKIQMEEEQAQKITPGRIGSVFFFLRESFMILDGKSKLWGRRTGFGKYEAFFNNFYVPVEKGGQKLFFQRCIPLLYYYILIKSESVSVFVIF